MSVTSFSLSVRHTVLFRRYTVIPPVRQLHCQSHYTVSHTLSHTISHTILLVTLHCHTISSHTVSNHSVSSQTVLSVNTTPSVPSANHTGTVCIIVSQSATMCYCQSANFTHQTNKKDNKTIWVCNLSVRRFVPQKSN